MTNGSPRARPFDVDHAAGKGILYLGGKKETPNVAAVAGWRELLARLNSHADQATIAKRHGSLKDRINSAKGSTAVDSLGKANLRA